ncbi:hypothetical protein PPYR_02854 [Photinus pyralis]|uniref:Uncharacterized protein n=1 Tax=Photinus pyralis TaxID=7054 RepID=A0A5N4A149_PHOPY|nr:Hermansky-Pudlak syndrome 3 protein homolog [Photinus pyralis]XP_031330425.1 Hermansky-Pudlak syndrome 3 protein homolog [Photinus pyralis]XP_031330426.1 Hermansky-Pudlak syndrome 3 protein homolog [Photinus pyralis]KAB0791054.1 hypothetical protein PPYR_02854 [Photinus pyralis]
MVRVITVHNFVNQHVQVVEQPTASTVAPPDRLLLALNSHCVEVRDLKCESNLLFTFPTVDQVRQLLHCLNGNYVATLESKVNRQNRQINYARVYVNWDSIATLQQSKMTSSGASLDSSECGMVQPMRARIAGRVTPTTNQSELSNLEMIEIPAKGNPCNVACCQISGNLLVQAGKTLFVYGFQVKTHDISKLRFLDFEELPLHVELAFVPLKITLCENYIACLNRNNIHMFKVIWKLSAPERSKEPDKCDINFKVPKDNVTIDYKELLRRERINKKEEKITVNLPSIVKSNSLIHKHSPFTFIDKEMNALVKLNHPLEDKTHKYELVHLIQLRLKPIIIENTRSQVVEEFKCLVLHPLYCEGSKCADGGVPRVLRSGFRGCLKEVVCVITTLQEGYLFQFCDAESDTNLDNCISVYPFMGPVYSVALEGHLLHALTETGLETYTVRVGHQLCRSVEETDSISNVCPPKEQLLCLIGHRQFIGIEQMLITDNYLVLLANGDNSPTHSIGSNSSSNTSTWTLYALELPTPKMIFTDIAIAANAHRFSAPQTYCHLMSEAHMILRLTLHVLKWAIREGNVCSLIPVKSNTEELLDAYHTSCCLLGDHFVINECNYQLCLPYYKMAGIVPHEVLKRFRRVQEESNAEEMRGIIYYLKLVLREPRLKAPDNLSETAWKQSFIEDVLQIFHKQAYLDLSYLIIKNGILREYCTHKLIGVLRDQSFDDPYRETERLLALGLLHMQEYNLDKAKVVLSQIIGGDILLALLEENWHLLFERLSKHKRSFVFSEFAVILMITHCDILSNTFNFLIKNEKVTLHDTLLMFMEYLQLNMGSEGLAAAKVMRTMLEDYFKFYFSHYESNNIGQFSSIAPSSLQLAMTVLVRSYLSQLQVFQLKEANNPQIQEKICANDTDEEKKADESPLFPNGVPKRNAKSYLFAGQRYEYLDKMPPFQIEITSKLYEKCVENYVAVDTFAPNEEADLILQKLQALLCSGVLPEEAIVEAKTFLSVNNTLRGYTSLMSILINKNDVVNYLLNSCPQCLLQYGKDCFTNDEDWQTLVTSTQTKIIHLSVDEDLNRICFYYKKILKDVLTHLATTLSVEDFQKVLPHRRIDNEDHEENIRDEIYSYDTYLTICKETTQANQIKKLITTTGHQLLRTLNL